MLKIIFSAASVLVLCLCFVTGASAGPINGSYSYALSGGIADSGCVALGGNGWRDIFNSTSGGNSTGHSDPVTFSICDDIPNLLEGGQFLISDGLGDTLGGTFGGIFTKLSPGDGDVFDGMIQFSSASGYYSSVTDHTGTFEVITGTVGTDSFPTGTIDFQSTPEPVTAGLTGAGLLLMALSRKFLKRRT